MRLHSVRSSEGKEEAGEGTRTPDPRITNALLYQLSYAGKTPPATSREQNMPRARIELATRGFSVRCSTD